MLFCDDAMSRAYDASVRYHSWTVAPSSQIANASPSVRSRNESSEAKSAPAHAGGPEGTDGDVDVDEGSGVGIDIDVDVTFEFDVAPFDGSVADSASAYADSNRAPVSAPIAPSRSVLREVMGP